MSSQDDLKTSTIAVVGFVGTVLVLAIVVLLMVVFYQAQQGQQLVKDINQRPGQVTQLMANQQGRLASYGWVDEEKGVAFIPISQAKKLVLADIARDPESASPVMRPYEAGTAATETASKDAPAVKDAASTKPVPPADDAPQAGEQETRDGR